MRLYSTNGISDGVTFLEAAESGLAPDGGLYMPESLPALSLPFNDPESAGNLTLQEISKQVSRLFLSDSLSTKEIDELIDDAITMKAPLLKLKDNLFVLELFHGPTLAFKDFGARFMARLFSKHRSVSTKKLIILVATSGDTGGAVANGFYNLDGVNVCLLFPKGKVSDIQRKQMTTLGNNITALEIEGTFDDCQRLVKQAFSDDNLNGTLRLSSANSINVARLLPQSFYFIHAWFQLKKFTHKNPVFVVPSGNFGNLTAGLMAEKMGMPVSAFVAATNRNKVVPEYLEGAEFSPRTSIQTISNAMDVGNPSNFSRIRALYNEDDEAIRHHIKGYSFTDDSTLSMIRKVYEKYNYITDPHTAIGLLAAEEYRKDYDKNAPRIVLSTAHPSKFLDVVEPEINGKVSIPKRLSNAILEDEMSFPLSSCYSEFKRVILNAFDT
ncbi:threonine synthase [Rhodohalobacter sp. 8-1]|uniref:threonine synthase n=1 Tax=Rhodohalobacter sp. 8-1 TaxID=3131972 RepID=UPI0030EB2F8E